MNPRQSLTTLTKGDRILLALFIPLILPFLVYLAWIPHNISVTAIYGKILIWLVTEFFLTLFIFAFLLFLWVVFSPHWIEALLVASVKRVVKYLVWLCGISVIGNLIAFLFL